MKHGIHSINPRLKALLIFSNFSKVKALSWRIPLALLLVIFVSGVLSLQISAGDGDGVEDLPPIVQPEKKHPKLDSALAEKAEKAAKPKAPSGPSKAVPQTVEPPVEKVKVIIEVEPGKKDLAIGSIQAGGGNVETTYENLVQAMMPVSALTVLADSPVVRFISPPAKPLLADITSQGLSVIGAATWQNANIKGQGVKIAILDGGFQGYASLLGTELPASVTTKSFRADQDIQAGSKHGTGIAEIIYDIAPGAQLYLINFNTNVELGNAVDWIIAQNVNIISHSVGWPGLGIGDGLGPINDMVTKANNAGILWVNAAGNSAQKHWSGTWYDPDSDGVLNFQSADETQNITATAGQEITVTLTWDDPWGSSSNDYDLYLDNDLFWPPIAVSTDVQAGNGYPSEGLSYIAPTAGTYYIVVVKVSSSKASKFDLFTYSHNLQYQVTAGSISPPADSSVALSVGAVAWNTPTTLETYSSQGPTTDGRIKPDIVAPTGVSTVAYSPGAFYGTSSSAPHASAAAALVKQANPTWTPAQIKSFLESRAIELGAAGKDNQFGSGRLNLGAIPLSNISESVAIPDMVSLFGDNPSQTRGSPFGPSWTTLVVKVSGATSGKAVVGDFLASILPADARSRASSTTAWDNMITNLNNTTLTQTSTGSGVWTTTVILENLFAQASGQFTPGVFRRMVEQELRTGSTSIAVSVTDGITIKTGSAGLWAVDAQIMLRKGWNLRSTPVAIADNTWGGILATGNKTSSIGVGLKFDPSKPAGSQWQILGQNDTISPLDGVYIYSSQDDALGARLFRSSSATVQPASKSLARGAWNLIGAAPDFTENFSLVTPSSMRGLLPVDIALKSVQSDWVTALSPGEADTTIAKIYTYTGVTPNITLGIYNWRFGQPGWSFNNTLDTVQGMTTYDAIKTKGWTIPFGGYWVFIRSPMSGITSTIITLAGKNQGILTDDWMLKLLTMSP